MSTDANTNQNNQIEITFKGKTFNPGFDFSRLARQAAAVFDCMRDGKWRTLGEISKATGAPEASVSARLRGIRDMIRVAKGDYEKRTDNVPRRRRGNEFGGLWEYRLILDDELKAST